MGASGLLASFFMDWDATLRTAWDWWLLLWPHLTAWGIIGLSGKGVRVERFLPTSVPFYVPYANPVICSRKDSPANGTSARVARLMSGS
jgi:hypothetical protein